MDFTETVIQMIPDPRDNTIDWEAIADLFVPAGFRELKNTPQNPRYHGEGDVFAHTRMVCEKLIGMDAFHALDRVPKAELFLSAVLHDIGKVRTTRLENGEWTSPNHASSGSRTVREFLWKDLGLCGTKEKICFRETVCALIAGHMQPVYLLSKKDPHRKAREIAAAGELAPDFCWERLCMLSEADVSGRIAADTEESIAKVGFSRMLAEEAGCLTGPYRFADPFTKRAYLSGRNVPADQPLYDDSWGEVILMAGLPGTGKDRWIRENAASLPTVSLDDIRRASRIKAADNQGPVLQAAQEQARVWLRKKQPFVWNATDLMKETRQKLVSLFEGYGAKVRIVYLETIREERSARNRNRPDAVPEAEVEKMYGRAVPPMPDEAETVEWLCV